MNTDRVLSFLRIAIPIGMAGFAFALLTALTNLNLFIVLGLSIAFGLLDVFVIAPLTFKSVDKPKKD